MPRKLFCQISPFTYQISVWKCCAMRRCKDLCAGQTFARTKQQEPLPYVVYSHKSLIRRTLGNVDPTLQNNKAINLSLANPKVTNVVIRPGEVFSFWKLVGSCTEKKGYREGLTIAGGQPSKDIGGGMCQFTNLIHWLVLHTPMQITEHHHHDHVDLFPDHNRQVPFGVGTSVLYNYIDYRFCNNTDVTFQLITWLTDTHLCGEMRADQTMLTKYHIKSENEFFSREHGDVYRNGTVFRSCIDVRTGDLLERMCIKENHAKVLYDPAGLVIEETEAK